MNPTERLWVLAGGNPGRTGNVLVSYDEMVDLYEEGLGYGMEAVEC